MKNNIDLIIQYLDGQLLPEDKAKFEELLLKDEKLNAEFLEYKSLMNGIKKKPELSEQYFYNLSNSFNNSESSFVNSFTYSYAFSFLLIFLLSLFLFKSSLSNNDLILTDLEIEKFAVNEEQLEEYVELSELDYIELIDDNSMDDIYSEYFNDSEELSQYAIENSYLLIDDSILSELENQDYNQLYQEMLIKNIR